MKKLARRPLALIMALALVLSVAPAFALADGEVDLASWSFISNDVATTATLPQNAQEGSVFESSSFSHIEKNEVSYTAGNKSVYTNGWEEGMYWQIDTSSRGYSNLSIDFQAWGSNTGPKNFTLSYSTDSENFTDAGEYELTATAKTAYSLDLPELAGDAETLILRFAVTGTGSINGGTIAATGTSRMAEIKISGVASQSATKVSVPVPSIVNGTQIASGTKVNFTSATAGAQFKYKSGDEWVDVPADGLEMSGEPDASVLLTVKAVLDGLEDSDEVELAYRILGEYNPDDPIPDGSLPTGAISLSQVIAASDSSNVTTVGQLVYRFGNYDGANSAIIQDIISDEIVSLQLFNSLDSFEIGDVIKITGQKTTYGGVPQMQGLTETVLVNAADSVPFIAPREYADFASLRADKDSLVSAVVLVKNIKLGTYNDDGSTTMTDSKGGTLPIFRAATYPFQVEAGETVNLLAVMSKYNDTDQLRAGTSEANGGRLVYDVVDDVKPPVIIVADELSSAKVGEDYLLVAEVLDNRGVKNVRAEYSYQAADAISTPMDLNPETGKYECTIVAPDEEGSIAVTIYAEDISGLQADSVERSITIVDMPVIKEVSPERGTATGDNKRPDILAAFDNISADTEAVLTLMTASDDIVIDDAAMTNAGGGLYTFGDYAEDLEDGKYKAVITLKREGSVTSGYEWSFTVGEHQFNAFFGQLHSHTGEYSDGTGTLAQGLDYIKNTASKDNVDFVAFTDHSNYFDSSGSGANPEGALGDPSLMTGASALKWNAYVGEMDAFNAAGYDVLAIPGFEMTWSGGPGHINTFNTEGIVSRNNATLNNKKNDAGMKAYYELLKDNPESISQFNHPGTTFGTFANFSYWDPAIDEVITLIEVGNGEGAAKGSGYFPSYEYYVQALDKGWHLAPTNNQDNHKGKWGNSNTMRSVIITDDFTEYGMLQGMRDMSMYSTEDKNLEIMYTVNGLLMGSTISGTPNSLRVQAEISDPDDEAIGTVEIVVNGGRVVHQEKFTSSVAALDFELAPDYSYYFLRVIQPDTDIAVTAPVWVGDIVKSGITEITTTTVMPIKDEELTFQTSVYNLESSEMTLTKLEYSLTHLGVTEVLETITDLDPIPGGTNEKIYDFSYTPDKLGQMTLSVSIEATVAGVEHSYESSIEFKVLDPNKVVPIAIDAGHNNFYVSGNYANSDAAFIEMCNRSGIQVTRLQSGELTFENIKDMALLVLTVPFKSFGTSVADSLYTEAEIAAIKAYTENGGNLIITSKSDRGDPSAADEKASAITNEILEAVGAKARVAEAIVVDPERKANEAFRITLGGESDGDLLCFNYGGMETDPLAAIFLKDVKDTTNNTFSAYNSAPIIANGATTLVSGFPETTYGTPFSQLVSNQVPSGGSDRVTGEGDTHLVVAETLAGGGFLITSGVTFFSTFEVKPDLDYAGQLQNSNYQLVQNILDVINPEVVSPISDVHEADEGITFTIEGIATSNASGYDRETAFFDCIYVQDDTGGINVFPVEGNIQAGQTIRITGDTSSYNGERQLEARSVTVIDSTPADLPDARKITALEANTGVWLGSLVSLSGTISEIELKEGLPEAIYVTDNSGATARVFIDGYITSAKTIANLVVGNKITAVGLSSHDAEGYRIRIRDREDIICTVDSGTGSETGSGIDIQDPETPMTEGPGAPVTFNPTTTAKDGVVVVEISSKTAEEIVQAIKDNLSGKLVITPDVTGEYGRAELIIELEAIRDILGQKDTALTFNTGIASISLSADALSDIANKSGDKMKVIIEYLGDSLYEITIQIDDSRVEIVKGRISAVLKPYSTVRTLGKTEEKTAVLIGADGSESVVIKSFMLGTDMGVLLDGSSRIRIDSNTKLAFVDVPSTFWSYSEISFLASRNVLRGVTNTSFEPNWGMTRAMAVTVLHRLERELEVSSKAGFGDVSGNMYYAEAVDWAVEKDIVEGVGDNLFAPDADVTRAQLATMVYRYAAAMGMDVSAQGSVDSFPDKDDIPSWSLEALKWAVEVGLFKGNENGELAPLNNATRAEMSTLICRLVEFAVYGEIS